MIVTYQLELKLQVDEEDNVNAKDLQYMIEDTISKEWIRNPEESLSIKILKLEA
jgi:hypothetical protein